jgi:multiple sugar transport system substrate-binding protein
MSGRQVAGVALAAVWLTTLACGVVRTDIVFWQFWPAAIVQPILDRFEKTHPGVHVRMEQLLWQDGLERIRGAIVSRKVPDLCELGSTWMPRMLEAETLTDWTSPSARLRDRLNGWELCSSGGRVYGIPWLLGTRALFYDKTLFARAGLDSSRAPQTWQELYDDAEAIQKLGHGIHGFGVQAGERGVLFKKFMPFGWGNGGQILSDDLRSAVFDSPENRQALEFYVSLRAVGLMDRQAVLEREFKQGRLGMQITGAWPIKSIPRDAPGLRYGVGLVPCPELDRGTHASFAGGEVLVSFKASRQPAVALELARYLVRPENTLAVAEAAKSVQPANAGADTTSYYREHPNEQVMVQQFETAFFTPNHPAWMDMEAAIEDEVEQALLGRKSPAQAVSDAQRKLTKVLGAPPRHDTMISQR